MPEFDCESPGGNLQERLRESQLRRIGSTVQPWWHELLLTHGRFTNRPCAWGAIVAGMRRTSRPTYARGRDPMNLHMDPTNSEQIRTGMAARVVAHWASEAVPAGSSGWFLIETGYRDLVSSVNSSRINWASDSRTEKIFSQCATGKYFSSANRR